MYCSLPEFSCYYLFQSLVQSKLSTSDYMMFSFQCTSYHFGYLDSMITLTCVGPAAFAYTFLLLQDTVVNDEYIIYCRELVSYWPSTQAIDNVITVYRL